MKLYYRADTGFNRGITFGQEELEKIIYAFLIEKRVLLADGQAMDGKYIQQISPDWHGIMGWAEGYRLGPEDFNEIAKRGADLEARKYQAEISANVRHLIATGQVPSVLTAPSRLQLK
jgi:hypothetical protein